MAAAFVAGLAIVALSALLLSLVPASRIGALASALRFSVAGVLGLAGIFVMSRGLALPGLVLLGVAGLVITNRRRLREAAAGGEQRRQHAPPSSVGAMTLAEAYDVLGLAPGATADDVRNAHRTLIQKLHPDHGGTSYLAAKLNGARDLLLEYLQESRR